MEKVKWALTVAGGGTLVIDSTHIGSVVKTRRELLQEERHTEVLFPVGTVKSIRKGDGKVVVAFENDYLYEPTGVCIGCPIDDGVVFPDWLDLNQDIVCLKTT